MKPVDRRGQEQQTQPTPLMTQNGGAGMMMQQQQMYPGGYQMPPSIGYPTAPATPSGIPSGAAPPPTMMYPNAPPTPMMQPVYSHGYAR
ncbi:hypothetical protein PRIPAC_72454 [Pristionchus pacificus]|uniref:Uncharacterized protein n=1 Tax=Pristionchus pacificus TaxID=54126 RepID=A0A454XZD1_PRIPA|nr:hypothetical protein PRIPAC_72454 [Pristionchus pacificus]|eukprot:PDM65003.1 hypothetical protein PRIPAC_53259 [Pristionchus pacificus]